MILKTQRFSSCDTQCSARTAAGARACASIICLNHSNPSTLGSALVLSCLFWLHFHFQIKKIQKGAHWHRVTSGTR